VHFAFTGKREASVEHAAVALAGLAKTCLQDDTGSESVRVLGPAPAPLTRIRDEFRWQLLLLGPREGVRVVARELVRQAHGRAFAGVASGWMPTRCKCYEVRPMILEVLQFPDARLREKALPVAREEIDDDLRKLAAEMAATMYDEPGIGLAATQVGVAKRLIVMDLDWTEDGERRPRILLNPEISKAEGTALSEQEGCLSVPDFKSDVERNARVVVRARTLDWEEVEFDATELEAYCFQHEIDHLDGVLFIDRISKLKRLYVRRRKKHPPRAGGASRRATPTASCGFCTARTALAASGTGHRVVSQPDRRGRGRRLRRLREAAARSSTPVLQPARRASRSPGCARPSRRRGAFGQFKERARAAAARADQRARSLPAGAARRRSVGARRGRRAHRRSVMRVVKEMDAGEVCLVRDRDRRRPREPRAPSSRPGAGRYVDALADGRAVFTRRSRASRSRPLDRAFAARLHQPAERLLRRIRAATSARCRPRAARAGQAHAHRARGAGHGGFAGTRVRRVGQTPARRGRRGSSSSVSSPAND
jgi:peptide deformylase